MKTKKLILSMFVSVLTAIFFLAAFNSNAQTMHKPHAMKDCCMMKDGKMMVMKDGKTMVMRKDMTMKNGTKCMTNGEYTTKDGKKMMMKEGEYMEMSGKISNEKMKAMSNMKTTKNQAAMAYTCPMHHEIQSDKPGKCPKCGMTLVKK